MIPPCCADDAHRPPPSPKPLSRYHVCSGVQAACAERWVAAVDADGTYGRWEYAIAKKMAEVNKIIESACSGE